MNDQPPPEHEHGGEYRPDTFAPLGSLEEMPGDGPAVGCLLLYLMVVVVFAAEMLRYFTGNAKWWPLLLAIPFLFPRIWAG